MAMEIRQTGVFGAEITGVDLARLSDEEFGAIREAFVDHGVVFFRDQDLTEDQHIAFARRWGQININRFFAAHPAYPEIALVVKEAAQKDNIGGGWHTDHSYDEVPALGSILLAREVPPSGGNTLFASMYAAYDALPDYLKREVEGVRAVHSAKHIFGTNVREELRNADTHEGRFGNAAVADVLADVTHPIALVHPLSGRKAIYVNPAFTIGVVGRDEEAGRQLLTELYKHCVEGDFATEFVWAEGSMAFWDNRATWHYALNDYHGHRREMHRITLEGEPLP
ncbi:TauD/TfdA family dioxygenase [Novosphingobium sp. MD-1]|uniref:TauD/TfdA dioxygenase family protein n=1 Tax=Novosphingobium sp. MD-1 TaxID=1630648 RepID=UPI00061C18EC|nr:TauD/TfdA family dioxygenase [Novosphingobium sp. MD-1]GAO56005.1 alpha-ketoglutarate-dependent taurine dioxygenase [Novosphingobium sp. MD-1]